ncbi:hypothetical protein [Achromobacter sp. GD03932]|uniref:Rz1-like lysis system protein LysC n=1 Tax=Achromobacter sp. GD03932 TaxID=2975407 RepID=UPI00244A75A7|nr:hypothetical protein [Achromobacter sp. GD03932]MDH1299530.1 hypothetical protein [Achromobacter sp. GD03932]
MSKFRVLCLLAAALTMTGCSTSMKLAAWPTLPANLAQPCRPVPEVTSDSWDDFARSYIAMVVQYGDCAARHRPIVEAWPR